MEFSLSTDQEILRESVRSFAENEIKPVAQALDKKEEFSYETMAKMAELGLFGIFVSEQYGGQGMDYASYIIATEEIARVDGSHAATVAAGNSLGIGPIFYFGSEEQKKSTCPNYAAEIPSGALASQNRMQVPMPATAKPTRFWMATNGSSTAVRFSLPMGLQTFPPASLFCAKQEPVMMENRNFPVFLWKQEHRDILPAKCTTR